MEDKDKVITEYNTLIAVRIPPGDNWILKGEEEKDPYPSLTEALEAYFQMSQFKGEYRLSPLSGELFAILTEEVEPIKEEPKTYSIYGEFKQGV
jgi:hypothetical protein